MAIIALKAWYIQEYEPLEELEKRPHDLRLSKNSLLKSALRADFLEDREQVKQTQWFQRYLQGENVEFYIEGSGGYTIANIDLSSHEIYFTKQTIAALLEPTIFFCHQTEYAPATEALREELQNAIAALNKRSRIELSLIESQRHSDSAIRLNSTAMRKIRKSLLFIADTTPITSIESQEKPQLIPSPNVCVEIGYALQSKRTEQIILAQMQRKDLSGQFPFDLPKYQFLQFNNTKELGKILPQVMETQLQRFNLFV
ncbi:hypothetical protein [Chroococcidiopsis sp. TS-821]|uniref:hypothetical protein n=1 Tax=Chroococcidiopsis sp. TS-821 TaxID=1378066 RepID=UPI000CEF16FD|nr:hypothetical protein [Chroococcidiopsis sp. TS-821]PPS43438.1 hypothetical protein B1A85_12170 [Chroococcidiopsis sp. TS-821]